MRDARRQQRGVTLIELVASIVIIAVATGGLLVAISALTGRSADPMIDQQAIAIAEAYAEEITLAGFCDPDFDPDADPLTSTVCSSACTVSACGSCAGACPTCGADAARAAFDDVCDYASGGLVAVTDRFGLAVPALSQYAVAVTVTDSALTFGAPALDSDAGEILGVEIRVTHPQLNAPVVVNLVRANVR